MTAPINLEEAYNELSNLLKDVCSFLNTEVKNGTLNSIAADNAQKLVQRLKKQDEVISKISALQESSNSNYPYLQMQGPSSVEEPLSEYVDAEDTNHYEEDYEETENYAFIENEQISIPPTPTIFEDSCPFLDLSLSQMEKEAVKFGPLIRKERYFIIDKKKELIVGLVGYWLLIYCTNKKDMKPQEIINVCDYRAQPKKDPIFEIISENKKTHEFTAKSAKDMDQWIVAINCKKQANINARNLPSVPATQKSSSENMSDNLDKVSSSNTNDFSIEEPEDIYEDVEDIRKSEREATVAPIIQEDTEDDAPKLPARQTRFFKQRIKTSTENPTYNNVPSSSNIEEEDEDNTYDPVQNGEIEEEEEEIYDEPKLAETFNINVKLPVQEINKLLMSPILNVNELTCQTKGCEIEEDDEECSYDIPRSEDTNQSNPPPQNYDEYEDEDVEYDELKIIPQNNNEKNHLHQHNKPDLKIDITPEKTKPKPVIISPKPKLSGRIATAFSRKSDNTECSQEGNNSKRIHNIIQQMEASLTFKGKN